MLMASPLSAKNIIYRLCIMRSRRPRCVSVLLVGPSQIVILPSRRRRRRRRRRRQ